MKLTTKGRYAVTAMLDLAINSKEKPTSLAEISGRQEISLSYLEQLFTRLRRKELVKSTRGPGGGYRLNHAAADISVLVILDAIEEKMDATRCASLGGCMDGDDCMTHVLWCGLSKRIREFLGGISLGDLVENNQVQEVAERLDCQLRDRKITQLEQVG